MLDYVWLIPALPLAGFLILLVAGKRLGEPVAGIIGTLAVAGSFLATAGVYFDLMSRTAEERTSVDILFTWLPVGGLHVDVGTLVDPLSISMCMFVTGIAALIHVYSIGYMHGDPKFAQFFLYLNLFVFSMLVLVLGDSLLLTFVGWEGVGLCSYLLISFWFTEEANAVAGKKAFVTNRIGDFGFMVAIFLTFLTVGSLSYVEVLPAAGSMATTTVTAIAALLFLGAVGKSAQIPLYVWLPDAMAGPTPVSALIHAATMVTAGVYLIARSSPIFSENPTLQLIVVSVGALTLLIGCIIGAAKDDIKRVLAWSTVSQIGYMFLGVGLGGGAYALAIIHLLAHGFFKANMFLGAGSVMHGMSDQVDIRRFGGLSKHMKITWLTFAAGWLAIIGIPPLSGYFTKEPIIAAAFERGDWTSWLFGGAALLGAGLTAFYMTRLFVLTFHGPKRWTDGQHPHESPPLMTIPLILLAIGSIVAGWLMSTSVVDWLKPVFDGVAAPHHESVIPHWLVNVLGLVVTVLGAGLAWALFRRGTALQEQPAGPVVTAARANLYTDAFNEVVFEKPGRWLTRALVYVDNKGVDGVVNGLAALVGGGSGRLRRLQTGFVRSYALSMLAGGVLVLGTLLAVRLR